MKKLNKVARGIIFLINIIVLLFNIKLHYRKKIFILELKNSDFTIFEFLKKSYNEISTYLNIKYYIYNIYNSFPNKTLSNNKKTIRIQSIDSWKGNNPYLWIKNKLGDEFNISLNDSNPDYLIYNVFGNNDINLLYRNCVRIAFYTENIIPDINYADYILAHYHINYLDRYFKYSIFLWRYRNYVENIRKGVLKQKIRNKFCAGVISNCLAIYRNNFLKKLNNYKKVDMGGKCNNTIGRKVKDKLKFLMDYKFSIALENSDGDGYISEKIVESLSAGTIPIYYGDYIIDEFINPKTYILLRGEKDIENKIKYIKQIDEDNELYKSIMKEKPFLDVYFDRKIDKNEILYFLRNIFRQDKEKAFRRDKSFYDFECENHTF